MELYFSLFHFIKRCSLYSVYFYCCIFIILHSARLEIEDDDTTFSPTVKPTRNIDDFDLDFYKLKPHERYKKFEVHYSFNEAWNIINNPQYASVPVVKKIKKMWLTTHPPKIIKKKPRKRSKNATTTTPHPDGVTSLVQTTEHYETTTRKRLPGQQNPFVLIEGTLTSTRRKLLKSLITHTTFVYIRNFRHTPFKYRDKLMHYQLLQLKRAFVTLQFYITARDVTRVLEDRPVMMSGFWLRQAAEYIARRYPDISSLPKPGSPCYEWPEDLVKPDLIYFLHTPRNDSNIPEDTVKRLDRICEIYKRMNPSVTILDSSYNALTTQQISQLRKKMLDTLTDKYPHAHDLVTYAKQSVTKLPKKKRKKVKKPKNITEEADPA